MKFIVVESGGTKSTWKWQDNNSVKTLSSDGLHPFEMTHEKRINIKNIIQKENIPIASTIYFYGAGCESAIGRETIQSLFNELGFTSIIINTDLLAACRATLGNKSGVTAILGTGAISANYNGKEIIATHSGWGYILGDEGSGFDIGKRLLRAYLKKKLTPSQNDIIESHFEGKSNIFPQVYGENGRKKVASLAKKFHPVKKDSEIKSCIISAFDDFYREAILPHGKIDELAFVGSIAYYYQEELKEALVKHKISVSQILPQAIDKLFEFHRN